MEKIRIGKKEQLYEIRSILPETANIMKIVFVGSIPITWGDITIYTEDGTEATILYGYETVWKQDGQAVYLSNDGSIYVPPAPSEPVPPPEPYIPTLEEVQAFKRSEISATCEQIIFAGVNVTLSDGTVEHYSLTEHDQLNLFGKLSQITAGATQLEYHADGQPCRYYSAVDMQTIIQAAMWHVSYHTTYCNALNMWIAGCQTVEEVQEIFYGADVPKQYRSEVLDAYLVQIAAKIGVGEDGTPIAE